MRQTRVSPWASACCILSIACIIPSTACSGAELPVAVVAQTSVGEPIPVTSMPPPALAEEVPPRPNDEAVWADGCWEPSAQNWVWLRGGWVVVSEQATLFRGKLQVGTDGALWWQPCTWFVAGKAVGWLTPITPASFPLTDRTIYAPPS